MEDREIVALYWSRDTRAIRETELKYGGYCGLIARNMLGSSEDAEECVNDTYLRAWNSIPPHRPDRLAVYLGKITRNLSLDRSRRRRAERRGGGQLELVLDELAECAADAAGVEEELDRRELARSIEGFLDTLSKKKRALWGRTDKDAYGFGFAISVIKDCKNVRHPSGLPDIFSLFCLEISLPKLLWTHKASVCARCKAPAAPAP